MPRYRLSNKLDWSTLHNQRVLIDVSDNYVVAVTREGDLVILAQAVHPRQAKQVPPPHDIAQVPYHAEGASS